MSVPARPGSTGDQVRLTTGYLARHMPRGAAGPGREAALVDIAQDLLLRELAATGLLDEMAFKGGTSLRKLYAGTQGRFSLDLDFSVAEVGSSAEDLLELLVEYVDGLQLGPFDYGIRVHRGKRHLLMSSAEFGQSEQLDSKIDVSAPPWLPPVRRAWVPMMVHRTYGDPPLPHLLTVRLEENLAEKISRLNRATPARDMYDLAWVANTLLRTELDLDLLRRLAVLKIWTDACGVSADGAQWRPGFSAVPFEPDRWLAPRRPADYDEEDIGALAVPPPRLQELSAQVSAAYSFLADLDDAERTVARANEADRSLVLTMLQALPGERMAGIGLR